MTSSQLSTHTLEEMDIDPVTEAGRDVPSSLLGYNHDPLTLFGFFLQDLPKSFNKKSENEGYGNELGRLLNIQNFFLALSTTPLSEEDVRFQRRKALKSYVANFMLGGFTSKSS